MATEICSVQDDQELSVWKKRLHRGINTCSMMKKLFSLSFFVIRTDCLLLSGIMVQNCKHYSNICLTSLLVCLIGQSFTYPTGIGGYRANGVTYATAQPGIAFAAGTGVIKAAIQTRHKIDFVEIPSMGEIKPTLVEVGANIIPVNILFRSSSSLLRVQQVHQGASPGEIRETTSQDEPHHLRHTVTKPIVQEVREIISPYRRIVQEIQPVQEEIQTLVARGIDGGFEGEQYGNAVAAVPNTGQGFVVGSGMLQVKAWECVP